MSSKGIVRERVSRELNRTDLSNDEFSALIWGNKGYSRWMNNGNTSIYTLYKMAMYFNVRMDYLLGLIQDRLPITSTGNPTEHYKKLWEVIEGDYKAAEKITGCSATGLRLLAENNSIATIDTMVKICTTLDVSCDWMFGTTESTIQTVFTRGEDRLEQANEMLGNRTVRRHRSKLTLSQINALARKEGLSYGNYVAKYKL